MRKTLLITLVLLSSLSFAQDHILFTDFKSYPSQVSKRISIRDFPDLLMGEKFTYKTGIVNNIWEFVSLSEFEEIQGKLIYETEGMITYNFTVIANDYGNKRKKFIFNFEAKYIDGREGLILNNIKCLSGRKLSY
jgi:hypothetical protein